MGPWVDVIALLLNTLIIPVGALLWNMRKDMNNIKADVMAAISDVQIEMHKDFVAKKDMPNYDRQRSH